jgi:hypothetical protein
VVWKSDEAAARDYARYVCKQADGNRLAEELKLDIGFGSADR